MSDKNDEKTVRDRVFRAIKEMDENLSETDIAWNHAAFLIASFILGPDAQAISDELELDPIAVGAYAERARQNGIWKDGKSSVDDYAGEDNGIKFWLDCAIIGGSLKRVDGDKYQMTDEGKIEAEKLISKSPEAREMMQKMKAARDKKKKR